jgi:hypothetical protein
MVYSAQIQGCFVEPDKCKMYYAIQFWNQGRK